MTELKRDHGVRVRASIFASGLMTGVIVAAVIARCTA